MSTIPAGRIGRHDSHADFARDVGEIQSLEAAPPSAAISGAELHPGEAAASLFQSCETMPAAIEPLTKFLGSALTFANPAWSGDPVPRMRGLQKTLVEHALTLKEGARGDCLNAITVVERAVQLRLRFQQLRMTELDMFYGKTESEKTR